MPTGTDAAPARLPFQLRRIGSAGRLVLADQAVLGWLHVDRLELEIPDAGDFDAAALPERFQRRRTQLLIASLRVDARAIDARLVAAAPALAAQGVTAVVVRMLDGHAAITARVADGLAAADVSFRIHLAPSGLGVRVLCGEVRVHGHLPTPAPVLAHRILVTLLGAVEAVPGAASDGARAEQPRVRGLCDVELDPLPALLWRLLPSRGWRLPATTGIELIAARVTRAGVMISYVPAGQRLDAGAIRADDVLGAAATSLVLAHDAMHTADELLRRGQLDDAMRGYRALLAAGGPDQPVLLGRILAIAAARPGWFVDGLELARQALGRWPGYAPALATLASIALAKGDARDAAAQLAQLATVCGEAGDDGGAALSSLAGARLLRVLDPRGATRLFEQALIHHPGHAEAVDALADGYAEEGRWQELARLYRARLGATTDRTRAVRDHLRLAELLARRIGDRRGASAELARARELAPDDAAVHEAIAALAEDAGELLDAAAALGEVARLARDRRDRRAEARAWARRAGLLDRGGDRADADAAWTQALALDADDLEVMRGAARARGDRGDAASAAALWRQVRARLDADEATPLADTAEAALALGRTLTRLGDLAGARAALADACRGPAEIAADAHQLLAELSTRAAEPDRAAAELALAIAALCAAADAATADARGAEATTLRARAAGLALERAQLLGDDDGDAHAELRRAHQLASPAAPAVARAAARALLARARDAGDDDARRLWTDALLAAQPPDAERASLLVRRARLRLAEGAPPRAALADIEEALALAAIDGAAADASAPDASAPDESTRAEALAVQAQILAHTGDTRGRAQALAARARLRQPVGDRIVAELDAAAAWLMADEPAAALPHASRAAQALDAHVPPTVRQRALATLGEAAWRQRAWADVALAAEQLLAAPPAPAGTAPPGAPALDAASWRHRLAVALDRLDQPARACAELERLLADDAASGELRGQAQRMLAELTERAGELARAAASLEAFAADPSTGAAPSVRADAWYRAAELYRRASQGDGRDRAALTEDAVRCLEGVLRLVEDHLPALDALEQFERAHGNLEQVAVILGRKIAASSRQPARQKALLARLAQTQLELGRTDVALEAFRRALELDPDYRPALRAVAHAAHLAGDRDAAATDLQRCAGPLPGDADDDAAQVACDRVEAAAALANLVGAAADGDPGAAAWAAAWVPRARAALDAARELMPADAGLRAADAALAAERRPGAAAPAARARTTPAGPARRRCSGRPPTRARAASSTPPSRTWRPRSSSIRATSISAATWSTCSPSTATGRPTPPPWISSPTASSTAAALARAAPTSCSSSPTSATTGWATPRAPAPRCAPPPTRTAPAPGATPRCACSPPRPAPPATSPPRWPRTRRSRRPGGWPPI